MPLSEPANFFVDGVWRNRFALLLVSLDDQGGQPKREPSRDRALEDQRAEGNTIGDIDDRRDRARHSIAGERRSFDIARTLKRKIREQRQGRVSER